MKATDILSEEHRVIERVIASLETGANRLSSGKEVSPDFFLLAADFIKGFADGCHHKKEEGVLFVAMQENGMPRNTGPLAVMLNEHEEGRRYTGGMRQAAERLKAGDQDAIPKIVENALGYAALLHQHIQKEDQVLFPMANQVIPVEQHEQIFEGFEHVEHEETGEGVHEKYLEIANELEKMMQSW